MAAPGTQIRLKDAPAPASVPTDTTTAFVTGISERGPSTFPKKIRNVTEFEKHFGVRVSYGVLWDWVDNYFREGGASLYCARVVGPSATVGTKNLLDGGAAVALIVSAIGPGSYSTGIFVGVVAGSVSGYQIQITDGTNTLEQSGDLTTQADAVAWALNSDYVRIAIGAGTNPPAVAAPAALSAGNDDRNNIVEANWTTALGLFTSGLGPGQVAAGGRTTDIAHTTLLQHAKDNRRVAILDLADTNNTSTLKTAIVNARTGNQRYGAAFAPWIQVAGIVPGTIRTIAPSSFVCGAIARNEVELGPDAPAAGLNGISNTAVGLSQPAFTDAQRDDLNANGVDVIMLRPNSNIEIFGWRSLVNAVTDPNWVNFGNVRLYMAIASDADSIAETFVFRMVDGQGHLIGEFNGAMVGMLLNYYNQGALYGQTAADAFAVDTGDQVNTPTTILNNELHAVLNVRMSPFAEYVIIDIVKTPINLEVA